MAGGGIKASALMMVSTDELGYNAVDKNPVSIHDLVATMVHQLAHRPSLSA